jgi:DnaJ family protein C protein 27
MDRKKSSAVAAAAPQPQPGNVRKAAPIKVVTAFKIIKIISMGSGGCGKSCLIKRYCEDRFVNKYIATIGVDYGVKPVQLEGNDVRVNFWDFSGHSEFFEIRNEFYKDAQGCILVYDVASWDSFNECDAWLAEAAKFGANPGDMPIALCANKVDKKRVVSEDEGRNFAMSRGLHYFEVSACSGQNVVDMFDFLFSTVYKRVAT